MNYPYSNENRLDTPHAYMYAPYGGPDFLASFVADRKLRVSAHLPSGYKKCTDPLTNRMIDTANALAGSDTTSLDAFSPDRHTALPPLMTALLRALAAGDMAAARPWLIRLVQRFEVSKKLYAAYGPGFRKGEGDNREPARYAELALCLALAHALSGQLQYLSTQLKLVDLLLSLDAEILHTGCSPELLELLVVAELEALRTLADAQGVTINGN